MSETYLHPALPPLPAPAPTAPAALRALSEGATGLRALPSAGRFAAGARGLDRPLGARFYRRFGKRALDIALVVAFAPLYLPLIAIAALLLLIEGGNPFYRQDRLGRGGARFSILKLRTMVRDADAQLARLLAEDPQLRREWHTTQKLRNDPRVTRVGAFLRRTSLDELPQLWNVLKGEMSLVGPRPMLPEQLPLYGDGTRYFATRPGLTGLWQVGRRNDSSFAERARYDGAYDAAMSLGTDLGILFRTIGVVLRRTGC
ncbi:MAG: sugar transferase [Roseovarius sp.]